MKKILILPILITACTNIYCEKLNRKEVDTYTYDQCIQRKLNERTDRTHSLTNKSIDDCGWEAYVATKKLCGMN